VDFPFDVPEESLDGVIPGRVLRQRDRHDAVLLEEVPDVLSGVDAGVVQHDYKALSVLLEVFSAGS